MSLSHTENFRFSFALTTLRCGIGTQFPDTEIEVQGLLPA